MNGIARTINVGGNAAGRTFYVYRTTYMHILPFMTAVTLVFNKFKDKIMSKSLV